ncbi:MAG TPA: Rrf2 family transcriptional regulator [Bryobacteraceae bacterium]
MRTISKRTKYALRALYALTRQYGGEPVLISTLARDERIPLKFLEAILLELKTHGIVESRKGRRGGYRLRRPPGEVTIGSVVRTLEGPLAPLPCASETAFVPCEECGDVALCGTRMVMREVRDAIAAILDGTTLEDVVARIQAAQDANQDQSSPMYYI